MHLCLNLTEFRFHGNFSRMEPGGRTGNSGKMSARGIPPRRERSERPHSRTKCAPLPDELRSLGYPHRRKNGGHSLGYPQYGKVVGHPTPG